MALLDREQCVCLALEGTSRLSGLPKHGSQASGGAVLGSLGPWPPNLPLGLQSAGPLASHADPAAASEGHLFHHESCCTGRLPVTVTRRSDHAKPGTAALLRDAHGPALPLHPEVCQPSLGMEGIFWPLGFVYAVPMPGMLHS